MYRSMVNREKSVSAILLGAGESKRMGRDKLMLPWGKKTVFEHCLYTLLQSEIGEVIVVLRTRSEAFEDGIKRYPISKRKKIKVAVNPNYRRGMSSSLHRGLKCLDSRSKGVLIALGDQPLLKPRTVNALIHAFSHGEGKIAIPFYNGKRGNPVLFDRIYMKDLMKLRGDTGGRKIVENHPDKIIRVSTRSEGVLKDIDRWEEYIKQKAVGSRQKTKD